MVICIDLEGTVLVLLHQRLWQFEEPGCIVASNYALSISLIIWDVDAHGGKETTNVILSKCQWDSGHTDLAQLRFKAKDVSSC